METTPLVEWNAGLFDCFEDASSCCYGFWCGPCLACTVSERFGENRFLPLFDICCGKCLCLLFPIAIPCLPPPAVLSVRAAMRSKYGIKGSLCKDIIATCCCGWCAWCQMHRELKHRRKTPTVINIQNQAIVQMQPPAVIMAPACQPQGGYVIPGLPAQNCVVTQSKVQVHPY